MGQADFRTNVTAVIAGLRPGEVVSYGDVAAQAGYPGAARAGLRRAGRRPASIPGVITAIVMIDAATDSIAEVAEAVAGLEGVSEVYSVAGDVDLIAVVRVREFEQVAQVIAGRINKVPGVVDTDTHIAFRAYSKHDLEAAFSIGLDTAG